MLRRRPGGLPYPLALDLQQEPGPQDASSQYTVRSPVFSPLPSIKPPKPDDLTCMQSGIVAALPTLAILIHNVFEGPVPPKKLPADAPYQNVALLPTAAPVIPPYFPGALSKRWPQDLPAPNICAITSVVVAPPPPRNLYDGWPIRKLQGDIPPPNVPVQVVVPQTLMTRSPVFSPKPVRVFPYSPDPAQIVTYLQTPPPPFHKASFGIAPKRRLPPPDPYQNPTILPPPPTGAPNLYETKPAIKRWPDSWQEQLTALLPTAAPPFHYYFEGVPPPKKLPPPISPNRLTPALPAGIQNTYPSGVPPKKYPPHMPVRVLSGLVIAPTNLAQLQSEFDTAGLPKKVWPIEITGQFVTLLPVAPPTPPSPPAIDYPALPKKMWVEDAAAPNIAALPPLIPLAQYVIEYDPQGLPKRIWPQDAPTQNILVLPLPTPVPFFYDYPSVPKKYWTEDAAPPNVPVLPTASPTVTYTYDALPKKVWPIEAAPQDFWSLPSGVLPPAQYDWPALPKKVWPDPYQQANFPIAVPISLIISPPPSLLERPKQIIWPDTWIAPYPLQEPATPIYIVPAGSKYIIYIPARAFQIATPPRAFDIRIPARAFTISELTVQTFDIKDPGESVPLIFDFSAGLATGETLVVTPTMSISVTQGMDPSPGSMLSGALGFDPTMTQCIQPVSGGISGCEYELVCTTPTSNPLKTLVLVGLLPVLR